jgi:peptide/nickel transport system ATP-binding protein
MSVILDIRGLSLHSRDVPLVIGVDLRIEAGERVGLIGESGSGKSLTALAAIGLLPASIKARGSVLLAGEQVIGAPDRKLDAIRGQAAAVVFQEPLTALDPLMRIGRQIALPLRRHALRRGESMDQQSLQTAVIALMRDVALPEPERIFRAYPHEISGGQRQRVAIAMALACRPALLIADEPTTALDVTTQAEILRLLDRLVRERGMALLFVSHDLPVVGSIVDRAVVLRRGQVVETGSVRQLLMQPQHAYTQSLVEAARTFDSALGHGS